MLWTPQHQSLAIYAKLNNQNGSSELRVLLIHGAREVGRFASKQNDKLGRCFNALLLGKEDTKP